MTFTCNDCRLISKDGERSERDCDHCDKDALCIYCVTKITVPNKNSKQEQDASVIHLCKDCKNERYHPKNSGMYHWVDHKLTLDCGCWMKFDNGGVLKIFEGEACDFHMKTQGWE